jgi:hypothetical protein
MNGVNVFISVSWIPWNWEQTNDSKTKNAKTHLKGIFECIRAPGRPGRGVELQESSRTARRYLSTCVCERGRTHAGQRVLASSSSCREIAERAGPKQQTAPATRGLRLPREASGDAAREPGGDAYLLPQQLDPAASRASRC